MATKVKLIADGVITPDQITLTTASTGTNTTAPATTAFVQQEISALVDSSPDALNTLNELAAALGDDANFSTTVTNNIALKAPLASPDFTGDATFDTDTLVVDATNNRVGIGASSPSAKLSIDGGTANNYTDGISLQKSGGNVYGIYPSTNNLEFRSVTGGNHIATFDYFGNVGIGTDSPDTLLHLSNNGTTPATIRIERNDTTISDTNIYGGIEFEGQDGSAASAAGIRGKILGVAEGATGEMALTFETASGYSSSTERMRIDSDGNLFLNTTSAMDACFVSFRDHSDGEAFLGIEAKNDSNVGIRLGHGGNRKWIWYSDSNDNLIWYSNAASVERMRILANGNVGIGTGNPQAKLNTNLQVEGSILAYMSGTSLTFDGGSNVAVTHSSSALGTGTAGGLLLANNNNSNGAPSPLIAFSARSASSTYNHTYATIHGEKSSSGADSNWNTGALIFSTGSGTGPNERMRITSTGSVAINCPGAAGHSFEVQDKSDGYSMFWAGRSSSGVGRGLTTSYGLMGVNSSQYDNDGAGYPIAGFGAANDNASHESIDFWFGSTQNEWQPMVIYAIGASTQNTLTGQTAGWACIRATHFNNGISAAIVDSGGGGTFTVSVQGTFGADRANTSRVRVTYEVSGNNRTVVSAWVASYGGLYGATRA